MAGQQTEIVDTVSKCRETVRRLETSAAYIALDTEGVHLSRTGPLTLMQIGTAEGRVYLFDVQAEPSMLKDGGLQHLLENNDVVKVIHAARNESEALYWQHGVQLRQVHDTQLARMEVERAEGRVFPPRRRLQEVVQLYCPEKELLLAQDKGTVQTKWHKTEGEYWAKRPLTEEMKQYAANDVIAIVPEVYTAQKRELEEKGLNDAFATRVDLDLRRCREQKVEDELQKQERELVAKVLKEFAQSAAAPSLKLEDIEDANVQDAITLLPMNDLTALGLPSFIRQLKLQHINRRLDEIEQEMTEKGDDYEVSGMTSRRLHGFIMVLQNEFAAKQRAQRLEDKMNKIVFDDIKRKYTANTPACHLDDHEKLILSRRMRPKGAADPSIDPVLLKLHWKVKMEDLEDNIARFQKDREGYTASEGYTKLLKYYLSGPVSTDIKQKATRFLQDLQSAGKVSRPPPRRPRLVEDDDFASGYY